ncbi:MAG: DsbA family protein [Solirubrobacteraceae bacterium]
MASRTKQKEEARARRLAEEQARAEQARRNRRLYMLGGVILGAIAIAAVAIAVSSGGSSTPKTVPITKNSKPCKGSDAAVCSLLANIPQSGNTIGNPKAPVTVTEYGDLQCPICKDFALGIENQLIKNDVAKGKVKLVYRSLETASASSPDPAEFGPQQAAAVAAGLQDKGWHYIELFYHHQGAEGTPYVNQTFLNKLAKSIPGLDYDKWLSDSQSQSALSQVKSDETTANAQGFQSTPTITIVGPKGQTQPIVGVPGSYGDLESAIKSVQ